MAPLFKPGMDSRLRAGIAALLGLPVASVVLLMLLAQPAMETLTVGELLQAAPVHRSALRGELLARRVRIERGLRPGWRRLHR